MVIFNTNSDIFKEKKEYLFSRFSSFKNFFVEVVIVGILVSYIITNYNNIVFNYISINILGFLSIQSINYILSLIILGLFYPLIGLLLTYVFSAIYDKIKKGA